MTDAAADPKTNVLIFGTSRVEDGVIPKVFDTAMQQAGISGIRSYNIAEPGKLFIESFSDAEDFFSVESHDIKYVLFEPNVIGDLVGSAPNSVRSLRFFAPQGAYWAMRMMSKPALDVTRIPGSRYVAHVLGAVIRRYFGIGLAWVQPEISAGRFSKSSRGFPDIDVDESATSEPHALARAMHVIETTPPNPALISDSQVALALSFAGFIRAHGAVPILVTMPATSNWDFGIAFGAKFARQCGKTGPLLMGFTSPEEYPELWDSQNRQNMDHLNRRGAEIFSRLLAQQLAEAIKDDSISRPPCQVAYR